MCADLCIHDNGTGNPHAHVLLTLRPFTEAGIWGDKQQEEYIFDGNGDKIYDKKKKTYKCKSIPTGTSIAKLKDDVKNVKTLRRSAENIMSEDLPERTRTRTRDLWL